MDHIFKAWDSFIDDLFSDTYILSLSITELLLLNSQCVGVVKEVNNNRLPGLKSALTINETL